MAAIGQKYLHALGTMAQPATASIFSSGGGLTATYVGYGDSAGKIAGEAAFTYDAATNQLSITGTDTVHTFGNCLLGFVATGSTGDAFLARTGATITDPYFRARTSGSTVINCATGQSIGLRVNNVDVFNIQSAVIGITQGVATSGSSTGYTWTGGAHTTLASGTEARDWEWNGARVVQFATTTPATQRQMWMRAATYSCDSVSQTITTAATLAISGPPGAGTNVAITTPLALWVQTGNVSFSENTDNTFTTGYGKMGLAASATSTTFYLAQASNYNSTDYALSQNSSGATRINCKTGQSVAILINGGTKLTIAASAATFPSGVPVTISDTTSSSSGSTGALIVSGGIGAAGSIWSSVAPAAAGTPAFGAAGTSPVAGSVTDSYTSGIRLTPGFSGAQTVTRHNYIDLNNAALSSTTLTDACVFRFDANAGTHKAVDSGTTKTSPGTVSAWVKINLNSTLYYIPCYTSKTT